MKASLLSKLFCISALAITAAPPSADQILTEAKSKAAAEKKAIYVHFGASWCGWCRKLDAWLDRPDIPGESAEVDWLIVMVKRAAPEMSDNDLKSIEASLREQKT